jgi:hypothetical protein
MSIDEYRAMLAQIVAAESGAVQEVIQIERAAAPKKRKVSAYSREFGRQYRALRKKHPRMGHGTITKKAHAATRKIRKPRK